MLERILIPLDGSEVAEAILPQVRRVFRRHRAEAILLQAVPLYPTDFHFAIPGQAEKATRYLRAVTFRMVNEGTRARGIVREGEPAAIILEAAREERVSLIAMSTHGRSGLSRWLLGSVAEDVARASPAPVLLVRSFVPGPEGRISRGRVEELAFRSILVPLDGPESAGEALRAVKELAGPVDARVTLLTVAEPRAWDRPPEFLERAERDLAQACIPARIEVRHGDPAAQILEAMREQEVDLVAMSTRGRSGPARWVLGSVTETVLRASTVPLLVCRRGARHPVPAEAPSSGAK